MRRPQPIGDFQRWKDHDAYQHALNRLLRDLKQTWPRPPGSSSLLVRARRLYEISQIGPLAVRVLSPVSRIHVHQKWSISIQTLVPMTLSEGGTSRSTPVTNSDDTPEGRDHVCGGRHQGLGVKSLLPKIFRRLRLEPPLRRSALGCPHRAPSPDSHRAGC
jgi:hypothetical protein